MRRISPFSTALLLASSQATAALANDPPDAEPAPAAKPHPSRPSVPSPPSSTAHLGADEGQLFMRPSGISATAQLGAGTAGIQAGAQVTGHFGPMAFGVAAEGALTLHWARSAYSGLVGPSGGLGPLYVEALFECGEHRYSGGDYNFQADAGLPGALTFAGFRLNWMVPIRGRGVPTGLWFVSLYGRRDLHTASFNYTVQSNDWSTGDITSTQNEVAHIGLSEVGIAVGGGFDVD